MKTKLLFTFLFITTITLAQIPTTNLIKEYSFTNASLQNTASSGGSLTPTGNARIVINDNVNQPNAIELNGDTFNAGTRGSGNTKVLTLSFWIKTNSNETAIRNITRQYISGTFLNNGVQQTTSYGWTVDLQNGKIRFLNKFLNSTTGTPTSGLMAFRTTLIQSAYIADNNWHHIVIKLEPVTAQVKMAIYVDNSLSASSNVNAPVTTNPNHYILNPPAAVLYIAGTATKYINGLDNFRVYNRALATAEMTNLYDEYNVLSIDDNQIVREFKLYPNPVQDNLHISLTDELEKIEIYSLTGRKILESRETSFSVAHLSSGVYIFKVHTTDNRIETKRFVKGL